MTALLGTSRKAEKYSWSLAGSLAIHAIILLLVVFGGHLFPKSTIRLGTGAGGGSGEESYAVGLVDELSGGAGMLKPSIGPKPPALVEKEPEVTKSKAILLPEKESPKKKLTEKETKLAAKASSETNVIPTRPEPGSGGSGGRSGGSGGGFGGGVGVSIGSGAGGFGDNWYARTVEKRISDNWSKPPEGTRVEIIYSFYIAPDGSINGVRLEKSCGNPDLDSMARRAILACSNPPLPAPPAEFRGRLTQFIAQFVYPPNQ
jgi:TonB family protein